MADIFGIQGRLKKMGGRLPVQNYDIIPDIFFKEAPPFYALQDYLSGRCNGPKYTALEFLFSSIISPNYRCLVGFLSQR